MTGSKRVSGGAGERGGRSWSAAYHPTALRLVALPGSFTNLRIFHVNIPDRTQGRVLVGSAVLKYIYCSYRYLCSRSTC